VTTRSLMSPIDDVVIWRTHFARWTLSQTVHEIDRLIQAGVPSQFITANLHTLMLADGDPEMKAAMDGAAFVLADGMPIVWAARLKGCRLPERVAGSDLLPALCEHAAQKGYRVFFLGGLPGVGEVAAERLTAKFPDLQIVGIESPPFRPLNPQEEKELVDRIRAARPHILFVAISQPKGDIWCYRNRRRVEVPVCVNLGASLDFVAGRVRRAPRWMQRVGLEWLHRISREPLRLTGRYTRNALFLTRMIAIDLVDYVRGRPAG